MLRRNAAAPRRRAGRGRRNSRCVQRGARAPASRCPSRWAYARTARARRTFSLMAARRGVGHGPRHRMVRRALGGDASCPAPRGSAANWRASTPSVRRSRAWHFSARRRPTPRRLASPACAAALDRQRLRTAGAGMGAALGRAARARPAPARAGPQRLPHRQLSWSTRPG